MGRKWELGYRLLPWDPELQRTSFLKGQSLESPAWAIGLGNGVFSIAPSPRKEDRGPHMYYLLLVRKDHNFMKRHSSCLPSMEPVSPGAGVGTGVAASQCPFPFDPFQWALLALLLLLGVERRVCHCAAAVLELVNIGRSKDSPTQDPLKVGKPEGNCGGHPTCNLGCHEELTSTPVFIWIPLISLPKGFCAAFLPYPKWLTYRYKHKITITINNYIKNTC